MTGSSHDDCACAASITVVVVLLIVASADIVADVCGKVAVVTVGEDEDDAEVA